MRLVCDPGRPALVAGRSKQQRRPAERGDVSELPAIVERQLVVVDGVNLGSSRPRRWAMTLRTLPASG